LSATGAASLFGAPQVLDAEEQLETTSVRLFKSYLICSAAPQYAAEELLRAEGFKEIEYVEAARQQFPQAFADGRVDFTVTFAVNHIRAIDQGGRSRSSPACIPAATSCSPAKASTASPN